VVKAVCQIDPAGIQIRRGSFVVWGPCHRAAAGARAIIFTGVWFGAAGRGQKGNPVRSVGYIEAGQVGGVIRAQFGRHVGNNLKFEIVEKSNFAPFVLFF
jgi:hypothetical protein